MHKVKRKETVFSISRKYGITEAELIAANPELQGENKIKKGSFLCIPYPSTQIQQNTHPQATAPSDSELFSENKRATSVSMLSRQLLFFRFYLTEQAKANLQNGGIL